MLKNSLQNCAIISSKSAHQRSLLHPTRMYVALLLRTIGCTYVSLPCFQSFKSAGQIRMAFRARYCRNAETKYKDSKQCGGCISRTQPTWMHIFHSHSNNCVSDGRMNGNSCGVGSRQRAGPGRVRILHRLPDILILSFCTPPSLQRLDPIYSVCLLCTST